MDPMLVGLITCLVVVIEGFFARMDGTFVKYDYRNPTLPFMAHGGIWADVLICPFVNALIWPYLNPSWIMTTIVFLCCLAATNWFHSLWAADKTITGHMWPEHTTGNWIKDMSIAGWIHLGFMTAQFTLLILYVFCPMPSSVVWAVAILMSIFWPLAALEPPYYVSRSFKTYDVLVSIAIVGAIWVVTYFKL